MDEEYQRKRLQARQQPTNFGEGMFRGVRGVGQGVIDGVTGVISKPVEGAKKGGVSGFLKGTGKGLIGVVTRPVSGVVDLATSMADSVKTVVTNAEEIRPIRPPRVITNDKIVRPFVYAEAIGYKIFKEINKGDFAETDCYLADGSINKHLVIVVTDKRVIEARQHELTGNWNADWSPAYSEMNKPEWFIDETNGVKYGVKISLKEAKRGTFSLLGRPKTKGKLILFQTEEIAKRVFDRMLSAWENSA
uniref:Intermembrane lipid transfer protein VPS13-like C-terminal domain-containing protein n=1 Tax=Meloidogyne incognita TaxID=6306 RepID=A0A914LJA8_MELIC